MTDVLFNSIITSGITLMTFIVCSLISLVLGLIVAVVYKYKTRTTPSFALCLAILPVTVQLVIMLVNGNIGAGVAVAGAFSLVRFRSAPGSAKEIMAIFISMAIGLATGMGYIGIAAIFAVIVCIMILIYTKMKFGEVSFNEKQLKITIPEDIDYNDVFDDIFKEYTSKAELVKVRTTNMGSLYQLTYIIELESQSDEKEMIDKLRCRNGNLEIVCSRQLNGSDSL